jgi:hypothetical protein
MGFDRLTPNVLSNRFLEACRLSKGQANANVKRLPQGASPTRFGVLASRFVLQGGGQHLWSRLPAVAVEVDAALFIEFNTFCFEHGPL